MELRCDTRPVLADTGQKCGTQQPRTDTGWGWVTLLLLPLGHSNNYTTASFLRDFLLPQGLCLFRALRPCFLFKEQVLPIQLQTQWPFPAVPLPSQGLWSWVSPQLLKALL